VWERALSDLSEALRKYGRERELSQGEVLFHQGAVSEGVYYLDSGRLGVYREDENTSYRLSEILPGNLVGELGSATGWPRTATVRAEEESRVVHISADDFHRAVDQSPALAAEVVCQIGERLTDADVERIDLGRSYQRAVDRVELLCSEKDRLEELLRLREELSDMIVHDLRNPLGVISGGLQLLERLPVAETELEYAASVVAVMGRAVRRIQRLVDTLMDVARLEGGEMELSLAPLDLRGLVEEAAAEQRSLAESKGLALESRLPADPVAVVVDREVILRVLINLVDNALKFTPGGQRVWIEVQPGAEEVRVAVVDSGPGVPLQDRERIFEKFTQAEGQAGARRGTGLGLAFCRMAVEAHGGRIWVEDGPEGEGSRFVFVLRTADQANPTPA